MKLTSQQTKSAGSGTTSFVSRRAFTLVELKQLAQFVRDGKQVMLALAPCGVCRELKGDLLSSALHQRIVTHLVVDTRSAGQALGKLSGQ